MSLLTVDLDGLARLAADCGTWSDEVAVTAAPATPCGSAQATAAAVAAVHAAAGSTAGMLSARMRATAAALTAAASAYTRGDAGSADDLSIGR